MNTQKCQTLVAIVGPTGVGKTAYAIEAAKKFNAELLSVDSRQLYTGMDIATGKEADLGSWEVVNGRKTLNIEGISLHGLDVVRPNESFSINDWHILASQLIKEIISRGKHPLLVGGTGFYLDSLQGNIDTMMVPPNQQLRENLQSLSNEELIKQLELLDRDKASNIDIHNKRKIIRAIEVAQFESATPIDKNKQSEHSVRYNLVLIGLTMNRDVLYQKIDARVDKMVDQGLIEETQRLLENYDPSLPSMSGIGYAEIAEYLNGRMSKVEAVQKMKWRIHAYVRRQYTWFNKQKVHWVSIENKEWQNEIDSLVQKYMY